MLSKSTLVIPAMLVLAAGQAFAQDDRYTDQPDTTTKHHSDMRSSDETSRHLVFELGSKMDGTKVENAEKENLGTVNDLVIDRGSGRVNYLVVKSGATLGMGGKTVLVPYRSVGWNGADHKVLLSATKDEIKTWPEFDKKAWEKGTSENGVIRTAASDYYDTANSPWPAEAKSDKTSTISGKIKSFTRRSIGGREELVMVVSPNTGGDQEIVMGPSWYTAGNNTIAFYRDTPVEVSVFRTTRDGRDVEVARTATLDGKTYTYYDTEGRPMWSTHTGNVEPASPFFLFTDIKGKAVYCRGEKCGKVKDAVVECSTGRVAFLSVDPDKEFLGIGDQNRLVPFSLVSAAMNDKVYIDADKNMITSAPTTPKDLGSLAVNDDYKRTFDAYSVQPPMFTTGWRR
jgi:sporulation protein YlmC with PRC-barrel domain